MANRFGPYSLLRRIAAGGMGEVYLAVLQRRGGFNKPVALKTMLPDCCRRPGFAERFQAEASIAAVLNHANIVQIFDHGYLDGRAYLVMELVEGPDLAGLLAAHEKLAPAQVAELGLQLCRALAHAHERRDLSGRSRAVVHGDISPANILVSREGQVKLADFGIARLLDQEAAPGLVAGKYSYMSPEQARGEAPQPASDLYSLALVLSEALTGVKALPECPSGQQALEQARRGIDDVRRLLPAELRSNWGDILARALDKDPERRFASAQEMARALAAASPACGPEGLAELVAATDAPLANGVVHEPTEAAASPVAARPGRLRARWALLALVVLFWGSAAAWWLWHPRPRAAVPPPPRTAPRAPGNLAVKALPPKQAATSSVAAMPRTHRKRRIRRPAGRPAPAAAPPRGQASATGQATAPKSEAPAPAARDLLLIAADPAWRLLADGRPAEPPNRLAVGRRRQLLVQLHPATGSKPVITLRLAPAGDRAWRLALRSRPWMNLTLDGRPAGQTPRAGLLLHPGRHRLVLHRHGQRASLRLEIAP